MTKIVVIGAVAAGTTAATKARRNDPEAEITIYDRDIDISYAICGIPYAVGHEVANFDQLTPRDPQWFKQNYQIDLKTRHEILAIDSNKQTLQVKALDTGAVFTDHYDLLLLATGARYGIPTAFKDIDADNLFHVRNVQSGRELASYLALHSIKTAAVVGAGYVGLEMTEQLTKLGIQVQIFQRSAHILGNFDGDMAEIAETYARQKGISLALAETVTKTQVQNGHIIGLDTNQGQHYQPDIVILAAGVKPNTRLAESIGVKLGTTGAIAVNDRFQTNLPNVYAVGDVAESFSVIDGRPLWKPLATTANKMGRIAGDAMTGGSLRHRGILGTSILRFFDLTIAQTGYTEKEAQAAGYDFLVLKDKKTNVPDYMPKSQTMTLKTLADKKTHRILGAQIIGGAGVDKRIDVLATAMTFKAKAEDLFHLDLAYSPAFDTTKDAVLYTGMILTDQLASETKGV
ncbi:FAD-dependent oxidoreductase [Agrilactobacillus fermenti]|uniref:FAD-dependent oxidoreductase n=1 Tax=Agrilactobacillus fermenti TaxID=2586909 RepID=UPI001E5467B9|nr:FAD-dependent oxidoreductase [Agrilactobacillus fermenti]MCD2257328.1 FAD-dependent oxidoreductase [Agrilactobacillus fermenti]